MKCQNFTLKICNSKNLIQNNHIANSWRENKNQSTDQSYQWDNETYDIKLCEAHNNTDKVVLQKIKKNIKPESNQTSRAKFPLQEFWR